MFLVLDRAEVNELKSIFLGLLKLQVSLLVFKMQRKDEFLWLVPAAHACQLMLPLVEVFGAFEIEAEGHTGAEASLAVLEVADWVKRKI